MLHGQLTELDRKRTTSFASERRLGNKRSGALSSILTAELGFNSAGTRDYVEMWRHVGRGD